MIAVDDLHCIRDETSARSSARCVHDGLQAAGRVADQFGTYGIFDALQLVVPPSERDRGWHGLVHIGSAAHRSSVGDD